MATESRINVPISSAAHPEHYRDGFRAGWDAAISTTPAPLDAERLARALCASRPPVVEAGDVFVDDECRSLARRVAREYAKLEGAPHE